MFIHILYSNCHLVSSFQKETWNTSNSITVKAETHNVYDKPPRSLVAKFYSPKQAQQPTLSNLELPPILVGKTCRSAFNVSKKLSS